jgi:hypothetical protein
LSFTASQKRRARKGSEREWRPGNCQNIYLPDIEKTPATPASFRQTRCFLATNGWIIYILRGRVCYHPPVSDEIVFDIMSVSLENPGEKAASGNLRQ